MYIKMKPKYLRNEETIFYRIKLRIIIGGL